MTTSEEREQAFILIFEKSFNNELSCDEIIELALDSQVIKKSAFTFSLFNAACENLEEIDKTVAAYITGRNISRVSKVSLAVLRLAICELNYLKKTPAGVVINEAVNLCKKYASEDEYAFVNGTLGAMLKESR
ncbi:MAG: transcription antitermination factor NusB [Clostridia bacterium]|nr:transcription antitermination factor NusB [Clostridia bacterium]